MPQSRKPIRSKDRIVIVSMIDRLSLRSGVAGGSERQVVELMNALDRREFRPIFICSQQRVPTPLWDKIECEKHLTNLFSLLSWKAVKTLIWLSRFLRKEAVDLVITFFPDSTLLGVLAARLANVKCVVSTRRDMGYWYDRKTVAMFKILNRMTTRVLANSHAVKQQAIAVENLDPERVDVIHNGIDLAGFDDAPAVELRSKYPAIQRSDEIVGLVANFDRKIKRVDLFIKAAAEVLGKRPSVKFFIVGGGIRETELRQLVETLGISKSVIFAGHVENTPAFVKNFGVGVLCSDSEGLSNTIIEYMAAGLPCVATAVGGNVELVRHMETGLLVEKDNASALAEAILSILQNKSAAQKMGKNARIAIENTHSWKKQIIEFEYYFRSLADYKTVSKAHIHDRLSFM